MVFSAGVIAFQTLDMIFQVLRLRLARCQMLSFMQPTWLESCPSPLPNVCPWTEDDPNPENFHFLQSFASFLTRRWARGEQRAWPTKMLAIHFVRTLGDILPGTGVYTASEVFTLAGAIRAVRCYLP